MGDSVDDTEEVDVRLPERLFATDQYPDGRLNIYSKPDLLYLVRKSLEDTDQWQTLVDSCFWPLFTLPLSRCGLSCKLIHALISRQLNTPKKYEMWTVFGGHPMRFSLAEFGAVTSLPCGEFPVGYNPYCNKSEDEGADTYWKELLGDVDTKTTPLSHISDLLQQCINEEGPRKLRLALLLIVDGVLIASNQTPRPTPKYVEMLRDVNSFLAFPWGRESFLKTIAAMRPPKKVGKRVDPVKRFVLQLQQQSMAMQGFPLALQLLALRNIPCLVDVVSDKTDTRSLSQSSHVPRQFISMPEINGAEQRGDLSVVPYIDSMGDWKDELKDIKVEYMVEVIRSGYVFKKKEWPGGDRSLPFITFPKKEVEVARDSKVKPSNKRKSENAGLSVKGSKTKRVRRKSGVGKPSNEGNHSELEQRLSLLESDNAVLKEEVANLYALMATKEKTTKSQAKKKKNIETTCKAKKTSSEKTRKKKKKVQAVVSSADAVNYPKEVEVEAAGQSGESSRWVERVDYLKVGGICGDDDWKEIMGCAASHMDNDEDDVGLRKSLSDSLPQSSSERAEEVDEDKLVEDSVEKEVGLRKSLSDSLPQSSSERAEEVDEDKLVEDSVEKEVDLTNPHVEKETDEMPQPENPVEKKLMEMDVIKSAEDTEPAEVEMLKNTEGITEKSVIEESSEVDIVETSNSEADKVFVATASTIKEKDEVGYSKFETDKVILATSSTDKKKEELDSSKSEAAKVDLAKALEDTDRDEMDMAPAEEKEELVNGKNGFESKGEKEKNEGCSKVGGENENKEAEEISKDGEFEKDEKETEVEEKSDDGHDEKYEKETEGAHIPIQNLRNMEDLVYKDHEGEDKNMEFYGSNQNDVFATPLNHPIHILNPFVSYSSSRSNMQTLSTVLNCDGHELMVNKLLEGSESCLLSNPIYDTDMKYPISPSLAIYDTTLKMASPNIGSGHEVRPLETETRESEVPSMETAGEDLTPCETVEVSDSSEATERQIPNLSDMERELAELFSQEDRKFPLNLLPEVDNTMFDMWNQTLLRYPRTKHLTHCGYEFDNCFLSDLALPKQWVSHTHMEVLVTLLSTKYKETLKTERSAFIPPWIANCLQGKLRSFRAAKNKSRVRWPELLLQYVDSWFVEVDTLYLPMIWSNKHWVGIVISLGNCLVEILDPNIFLYSDGEVEEFIAPVVELLPFIVKRYCNPAFSQRAGIDPFVWRRAKGIYKNIRSGDCGPVTMKFLEIYANGFSTEQLSEITDEKVDSFRKQYAMEVYQEMVAPIYHTTK